MTRIPTVVLLAFILLAVGCGSDDADPVSSSNEGSETTTSDAVGDGVPFGLGSVDLPESESEVARVFEAMPSELEGLPRLDDAGLVARYGGELNVLSAGLASDFDTGTVMASLASFEDEPGAEIEASELDPDAGVVWLFGSFQDEGGAGRVLVATWGDPDGEWLFSVGAQTPEMREALVRAFADAA